MLQNLLLSGMIIAALIPIAAAGLFGLGAVVAIHEAAEIVVIADGLRARRTFTEPLRPTPTAAEPRAALTHA